MDPELRRLLLRQAGVVSRATGTAWRWELLPDPPPHWSFTLTVDRCPRRGPGVRVGRGFVDPTDVTTRRDVRVLTPPLAGLQAAVALEQARPGAGTTLLDRAKQRRWTSDAELQGAFRRHRGTWGSPAMRRLLERTGDRAHSELERLAVRLLRAAGIDGFVVNHRTVLPGGRPVELRRADDVMAAGWTLRRFTWSDLLSDPEGFVAAVREVLAV